MFNVLNIKTLSATILCGSLMAACGSDNDRGDSASLPDVSDVQANYVDMAFAVYSDSLATAKTLQAAVDTFVAAPTAVNLTNAREAYKSTRGPYQQSEIYRWDESITSFEDLSLDGGLASVDAWEGQVNAWPLDETLIEVIIVGTDAITAQFLIDNFEKDDNEANVTTGVHAVEFMLWDRDAAAQGPGPRTFAEFSDVTTCDASTGATEAGIKCRNSVYLKAATDLLVADLTAMKNEWNSAIANNPAAKTLAYNFLRSDDALDYMAQAIASMAVGELGGARLSAGLWRPGLLSADPVKEGDYEEEHDCFSDLSHVAVFNNFKGVQNAFYGSYTTLSGHTIEGASLADYIRAIDPVGYNALNDALNKAEGFMQSIYDAGERSVSPKSFDQIIMDSEQFYTDVVNEKSAELVAVESALNELAQIENIVLEISEALSLVAVDSDAIGETD